MISSPSVSLSRPMGKRITYTHTPAYSMVAAKATRPGRRTGCLPALCPGGCRRLWGGQPSGDVGDSGGQLRVRPRHKRLACPQVELVLGQHPLHERGLEGADYVLAVGV